MTLNINKKYALWSVLILGLGIRLYSINYGLPYIAGPDEARQALDALSMAARKSLMPLDYTYPALHKYILLFLFFVYFSLGFIFRIFLSANDFAFKLLLNPANIFLINRLLSVFFGMALMIPVYFIGRSISGRNTGILACVFSIFMFHLTAHSQWGIADIMLAFLSACAFYYILRCMHGGRVKDFIFCGFFIGASAAAKYQGAYLLAPFFIAVIFNALRPVPGKRTLVLAALSIFVMLIVFFLGNLGFVFNFTEGLQRLRELKGEIMGISSRQPFAHNYVSVIFWFIGELIRQESILGVALIGGIIYAIVRRSKEDIAYLSYLSLCLFSLVGFGFRFLHLLVYSFPVICVFAAGFLEDLMRLAFKKRYSFSYGLIAAFIICAPSFYNSLILDIKRSNPDTRILAREWINRNIPYGAKIAEDWCELSVPLKSEPPFLFSSDKSRSYYTRYFDENMRRRYKEYLSKTGFYELIQARYETESPAWPQDMPAEAITRAENIPLVKRLYRWFNFRSIEELKNMKVSYVVISSYAYNHFLLDDDPRKKTGLFNPFMLEDTLASNRQAAYYDKNTKYGLLFFLNERARDFYLPFLDLKDPDLKLVKEIFPGANNLGPVIKIYELAGNK